MDIPREQPQPGLGERLAVNTVIQTIQSGIPVARIELMDTYTVDTVNQYSKLSLPQKPSGCVFI